MKHHRRTFRAIHVSTCGNHQHLCIDEQVEILLGFTICLKRDLILACHRDTLLDAFSHDHTCRVLPSKSPIQSDSTCTWKSSCINSMGSSFLWPVITQHTLVNSALVDISFFCERRREKSVNKESQSANVASEPTTVTQNLRNESPRSLQHSWALDHHNPAWYGLPGETARKHDRWRKPESCSTSKSMRVSRWHGVWEVLLTSLRPGELTEESLCLCGPPASHFTGENDQSSSSVSPRLPVRNDCERSRPF